MKQFKEFEYTQYSRKENIVNQFNIKADEDIVKNGLAVLRPFVKIGVRIYKVHAIERQAKANIDLGDTLGIIVEVGDHEQILVNSMKTPDGTIIRSRFRHEYSSHRDRDTFEIYVTDGGLSYFHRSQNDFEAEDLSIVVDELIPHSIVREYMVWGTRGKDGKSPLKFVSVKDMTTDHIEAVIETQVQINAFFRQSFQKELEWRRKKNTSE